MLQEPFFLLTALVTVGPSALERVFGGLDQDMISEGNAVDVDKLTINIVIDNGSVVCRYTQWCKFVVDTRS
jgi:hypothetical protein